MTRMPCCPARAPTSCSRRLPGGARVFVEADGGVHEAELAEHDGAQVSREAPHGLALPEAFGVAVGEAADQRTGNARAAGATETAREAVAAGFYFRM